MLSPLTKSVQVSLQSLPSLMEINMPTQLRAICKFTETTLYPHVQIINKDVKQDWPKTEPWGTLLGTN